MELKYYVLQHDVNSHKIYYWNVFNNKGVYEDTVQLIKERSKYSFEEFTERLRRIIAHEEWARSQYEIYVAGWEEDPDVIEKIDAYSMVLPNIELLSKELYMGNVDTIEKGKREFKEHEDYKYRECYTKDIDEEKIENLFKFISENIGKEMEIDENGDIKVVK